jgi:hypothetical protein
MGNQREKLWGNIETSEELIRGPVSVCVGLHSSGVRINIGLQASCVNGNLIGMWNVLLINIVVVLAVRFSFEVVTTRYRSVNRVRNE